MHAILADIVLIVHAAFIAFVVFTVPAVFLARLLGWRWAANPWLRLAHLGAIGLVVIQSWLGQPCPLTIWENQLRHAAGQQAYELGFIAHWLHAAIFFEAQPWVFTLAYTLFAALVVLALWVSPVRWQQIRLPRRRISASNSSAAP